MLLISRILQLLLQKNLSSFTIDFGGVELLRSLLCHSRNIHIDYYLSCFLHKLSSEGTVQWVKSVFTVWYLTPVTMLFLLQWIIIIISTDPHNCKIWNITCKHSYKSFCADHSSPLFFRWLFLWPERPIFFMLFFFFIHWLTFQIKHRPLVKEIQCKFF